MQDEVEIQPEAQEEFEVGATGNGNISEFDRLRERRLKITTSKTIRIDLPGYAGELLGEYRLLDWKEVSKIVKRMQSKRGGGDLDLRELYAQVDTLVLSCQDLLFRNKQGDVISLGCRYDKEFAQKMGIINSETARQVVIETFRNELAISAHHGELVDWMQGTSEDTDEEILGE